MSDSGPSGTFLKKFGLKLGLGLAAGVVAVTLGLSFLSFKQEEQEYQEQKQMIEKDAQVYRELSEEEKFKETWVVLVPVVKDCVEKGAIVHADALLMIHSLIRTACKAECLEIVGKSRERRRELLKEKNFAEYAKSLLSETAQIQQRIDECLNYLLSKLSLPTSQYEQSMSYWSKKDLLVSQVMSHTRAELSRLKVDPSSVKEFDHLSFDKYLEIRQYSFEKYKRFAEEFGGNLVELAFGTDQQADNQSSAEESVLSKELLKKLSTMVINSISDDLTFEKYGFEREELALIGSREREGSPRWDQDPKIKEILLLFRLQIQEDLITYSEL